MGKSRQAGTIQLCARCGPPFFFSTLVPPFIYIIVSYVILGPRVIRRLVPLFQVEDPGQRRLQRED